MAGSTASVLFKIVLRDGEFEATRYKLYVWLDIFPGVMYFATIFVANIITVTFILVRSHQGLVVA